MSSLAQEESRSISENVTWGHRKRFADGKVSVPYRHFLGYDKGPDGNLAVNKEQARTVNLIYRGDALLQKRFTVNFLTKETKANEGEVPQYYVENNHEAIISPQVFDSVQEEIKRRREGKGRYSGVSIFSSKIKFRKRRNTYSSLLKKEKTARLIKVRLKTDSWHFSRK